MNIGTKFPWLTRPEADNLWEGKWIKPLLPQDHPVESFPTHDQCVGYFERGGFYLYGARPGVGKTSMLLANAVRMATHGWDVRYANLEMPVVQMWSRMFCIIQNTIGLRPVMNRDPNVRAAALAASPALQGVSPIFWPHSDFTAFVRSCTETIEPGSNVVLMIDYLGLFNIRGFGPSDNYQLISEIAKQLKLLAVALNVPVIAATQLNREVEKRKEGRLILADLRGSGELENHADAVFGLTRENPERMDVTVLKNRNGPCEGYDLYFAAERAAVEEWGQWGTDA